MKEHTARTALSARGQEKRLADGIDEDARGDYSLLAEEIVGSMGFGNRVALEVQASGGPNKFLETRIEQFVRDHASSISRFPVVEGEEIDLVEKIVAKIEEQKSTLNS